MYFNVANVMRIGIIGAGLAGLCTAVRTLEAGWIPTIFEQTDQIGGTWVYTGETGCDRHALPIHSSMYRDMRTNLPSDIMGFPNFSFPAQCESSFVKHEVVLKFLQDYTNHFDVRKYIKFHQLVLNVSKESEFWAIESKNLDTGETSVEEFDAVFVCNGHYAEPRIPEIPNRSQFEGSVFHSHEYRTPNQFTGRTVAVLGALSSGADISFDIAPYAKRVYLCHNNDRISSKLPDNVEEKVGFCEFLTNGVRLLDDSEIEIDCVIFSTGYFYKFPFFDHSFPLWISNNRVTPLFKHIVHIASEKLFFIGLTYLVMPASHFDTQVRFAIECLKNPKILPSKEEMYKDEAKSFDLRVKELGWKPHYAHKMAHLQWEYLDELAEIGGFDHGISPMIKKMYDETHKYRSTNLWTYKNYFVKVDNGEVRFEPPEK